jgi:hypothetical protein
MLSPSRLSRRPSIATMQCRDVSAGDTIATDVLSIDTATYDCFKTLGQASFIRQESDFYCVIPNKFSYIARNESFREEEQHDNRWKCSAE